MLKTKLPQNIILNYPSDIFKISIKKIEENKNIAFNFFTGFKEKEKILSFITDNNKNVLLIAPLILFKSYGSFNPIKPRNINQTCNDIVTLQTLVAINKKGNLDSFLNSYDYIVFEPFTGSNEQSQSFSVLEKIFTLQSVKIALELLLNDRNDYFLKYFDYFVTANFNVMTPLKYNK